MTSSRRWLAVALVLAIGAAPALGQSAMAGGEPEFLIGPEDVLDISVWQNAELTRANVPVRPDGKISVVLLNDVQAAGLTPMQLRSVLIKGYAPFLKNQGDLPLSVVVREVHSIKVSVVGKVRQSGRFELKSHATVLDALAMAGGFTEFAKENRITVVRRDGQGGYRNVAFNYEKVAEGDASGVFTLQNGDVVMVK